MIRNNNDYNFNAWHLKNHTSYFKTEKRFHGVVVLFLSHNLFIFSVILPFG